MQQSLTIDTDLEKDACLLFGRYLSLKQAVAYGPYGEKKLKRMVREGIIRGGRLTDKRNEWVIDRLSFDRHLNGFMVVTEINRIEANVAKFLRTG